MKKRRNLDPIMERRRVARIFFILAILVFMLFIGRLSYIVSAGKVGKVSLDEKTKQLYQGEEPVVAKRGTIYDRNGEIIATEVSSYLMYVVLDETYQGIADTKTGKRPILYLEEDKKAKAAEIIEKHLSIPRDELDKYLNPGKNEAGKPILYSEFGTKGKGIDIETKKKLEEEFEAAGIKGFYFKESQSRMYPNGEFASYMVGYTDFPEDKAAVGVLGIEAMYDEVLSGTNGKLRFEKDSQGRKIPGTVVEISKKEDGADIYTTFDVKLQSYAEELMSDIYSQYAMTDMRVMLADAKTGNILAASQRPTFNPETKEGLSDTETQQAMWRNLLIEDPSYEPGSTMKVFTAAAAIDSGNFDENATFMSGNIRVDDATINDHNVVGKGLMTYRQAFAWSSNVGMVHLQEAMGPTWQTYLDKFGFGKSTNSGLSGESSGVIQDSTTVDRAMTAYGQGIGVTNFQMMQGFTAIANQGKMMKLNFIEKIVTDGKEEVIEPEVIGEPIRPETATKVLDLMHDVVTLPDYGLGTMYAIDGYNVGAKTGTAQIFENGGYLQDQYIQSVVQMAPIEDPEFIVYVTINKAGSRVDVPTDIIAPISNNLLKRALELKKLTE